MSEIPYTPATVRTFMDNILRHLKGFADAHNLKVVAYEGVAVDSVVWCHNYYAVICGYRVSFQIWTDLSDAAADRCSIQLLIYVRTGPNWDWFSLSTQKTEGMSDLLRKSESAFFLLQLACVLAMPRAALPNPVA